MSLILAIETSNPSGVETGTTVRPGVAVVRAEAILEVLGVEALDTSRANEDDLAPAIARLFQRLSLTPRQIGRVAVSVGPGGFTAVRLAVTTAKMIAEATGAQCLPVPTAMVVAQRVQSASGFAVALASKGETAFVTAFDGDRKVVHPGAIMAADGLAALSVPVLVVDQFLPPAMRDRAAELGMSVVAPVFDPVACAEVAAAGGTAPVDPAALLPLYPREPEAVTKWKKLHPR